MRHHLVSAYVNLDPGSGGVSAILPAGNVCGFRGGYDQWKLPVPNAFERSYTLGGSAGDHRPEAIRVILGKTLPKKERVFGLLGKGSTGGCAGTTLSSDVSSHCSDRYKSVYAEELVFPALRECRAQHPCVGVRRVCSYP
jgi:hypothetical protein